MSDCTIIIPQQLCWAVFPLQATPKYCAREGLAAWTMWWVKVGLSHPKGHLPASTGSCRNKR